MLKKIVNDARFTLRITTTGPILIRSGHASISGPDMSPVLTYHAGKQEIFLPGSSLKGVFRSHLEKIITSLRPQTVCYPFSGSEEKEADLAQRQKDYLPSCGAGFEQEKKAEKDPKRKKQFEEHTDLIYARSCPTCRLFGSTSFIGRLAISDAHLASKEAKELRDGVGIDRLSGGASHGAKFELEVVSSGVSFETDIYLRNFEIWQLGMLFIVLQDLKDELLPIGSGRSRGLGKVKASLGETPEQERIVTSTILSSGEDKKQLWGLGRWLNDNSYGTWSDDLLNLELPGQLNPRGIRVQRTFMGADLERLQVQAIEACIQRIQNWPPPSVEQLKNQLLASRG